ncbi:MAG: hypothetical protein AAFV80_18120, partial [Bacteroidota bacterium]
MFRMFVVLSLLFLSGMSQAQILNADRFGVQVDSAKRFAGDIQVNFSFNQHQTPITQLGTSADLSYLVGKSLFMLTNRHSLLRVNGEAVFNVGFTHFRYRYQLSAHWVPELFAQFQVEELRGLERRLLLGANLKYKVIEEEKFG